MKFSRREIPPQSREALRTIGARTGWLLESNEYIRVGFGGVADSVHFPNGLNEPVNAVMQLRGHSLEGDDGPCGSGITAFGAFPFDREVTARMDVPRYLITQDAVGGSWLTSADGFESWEQELANEVAPIQEPQSIRSLTYQPTPEEYAHRVALAVEILRRKEIGKVVLARAVLGSVPEALDAAAIATRLRQRERICTIYSLPIEHGRRFIGASPELLARRTGDVVRCHPLAGTIALPANVAPDDYETWLLGSTKNLHEHEVVVDDIVSILADSYDEVIADASPSIVTLRTVAHLGTWVTAEGHQSDESPDALDVMRLLHPTAAVGGFPRNLAYDLIARLEEHDRGHYAGPIGWVDANGDGEWWVGIRGVMVEGREFEAWAGAGIISESDPIAEREETRDKLSSVLSSVLVDRV